MNGALKPVLLGLALLLAACGQAPETTPVFRYAMSGVPTTLDPAHASNTYANFLIVNLYDTLYRYKYLARPYELVPNAAADMPEISDDGLTYTIRLKPGILFQDDEAFTGGKGREVTAQDFVYSIKRHFDPTTRSQGAWLWQDRIEGLDEWKENGSDYEQPVSGLSAVDTHTIRIRLIEPYPQFTHTLVQGFSAIVPREAVAFHGPAFASHPVGSGPYQLAEFNSARAELRANAGFRREVIDLEAEGYDPATQSQLGLAGIAGLETPVTQTIRVEFAPEPASRWNAWMAGELDYTGVPPSQFEQLLEQVDPPRMRPAFAERYHMRASQEPGFVHTDFNMADPRIGHHPDPQQDRRNHALRCAISKAFDWQQRNDVFYHGLGRVFAGIIPPGLPEYDPDQDNSVLQRDLEGARQLLEQHDWNSDNLPVLEYGYHATVTERQAFEQFRSFVTEIGYPLDKVQALEYGSFGDYARAYMNREVMLIFSSWTMDYPDAQNTVQLFYGPNASPGANASNFDNAQFNALYRETLSMPPSPERTERYRKMNRIVLDECATISGISRTIVQLWPRQVIMLPDRAFLGGHFFRFVKLPATQ